MITRLIRGGADENTVITCNGQVARGDSVWLVHGPRADREMTAMLHQDVQRIVCPNLIYPVAAISDVAAFWQLRCFFRDIAPDIVHTHTSKAGVLGRLAAAAMRVPVIVHGVHILPFLNVGAAQRFIYLGLEKACSAITDYFVSVSPGMRDECLKHSIGTPERHSVVRSGMDVIRFRNAQPSAEIRTAADAAVGGCAVIAVMVGAFEPRKRYLEILKELAPIMREVAPKLVLVLAGEGPLRAEAQVFTQSLGIGQRVLFLGHRSDVDRVIASADLCFLASEREGLPRVAVQYALAAKPIVITALPGIEVVAREGENARVVSVDRVDQLATVIGELARDKTLRAKMVAASCELDLSAWSIEAMIDGIEAAYTAAEMHREN